jgi:tRNA threonylcarbamoyl adenosine modification protein (Sua5/YciO/YrdC/YwlC family)
LKIFPNIIVYILFGGVMSNLVYTIHYETPEKQKIQKVVEILKEGGVILYPTDTGFSLGCSLSNKNAIEKLRRVRGMDKNHALTFLCEDVSKIAEFAKVSDEAYRTIKHLIPGPYTFILPASRLVPKFSQNPKRKTAGIRVPDNRLCKALLMELGEPIISATAKLPNQDEFYDHEDYITAFQKLVDVCVRSNDYHFVGESTVIDMTSSDFHLVREGAGLDEAEDIIDFDE